MFSASATFSSRRSRSLSTFLHIDVSGRPRVILNYGNFSRDPFARGYEPCAASLTGLPETKQLLYFSPAQIWFMATFSRCAFCLVHDLLNNWSRRLQNVHFIQFMEILVEAPTNFHPMWPVIVYFNNKLRWINCWVALCFMCFKEREIFSNITPLLLPSPSPSVYRPSYLRRLVITLQVCVCVYIHVQS